jgi:antitoxin (DNA-binding transcriptional repressor) of toxin-antitoxin stability system
MVTYNIHEAKTHFSKIMRQIERGDAVLIARDGVVIARISPETPRVIFQLGCDAGKGKIHDDFEAPLDDFEEYTK